MAKFNIKKSGQYLDIQFEHYGDVIDLGLMEEDDCMDLIAELADTIQYISSRRRW